MVNITVGPTGCHPETCISATRHVKEPEVLFEKELGTTIPGLLCIRLLSSLYGSSLVPLMDSIRNEVLRVINLSFVWNSFNI